jgi:hypothetical protein
MTANRSPAPKVLESASVVATTEMMASIHHRAAPLPYNEKPTFQPRNWIRDDSRIALHAGLVDPRRETQRTAFNPSKTADR